MVMSGFNPNVVIFLFDCLTIVQRRNSGGSGIVTERNEDVCISEACSLHHTLIRYLTQNVTVML